MTRWSTVSLRETPATVPALAAIALFVVWATSQAAYPLTHWAPGALIVLVLLAIAVLTVPLRFAEIPVAVKLALACLAAYTALSFLSIIWAAAPAEAWEGANRTLLYLLVFALFSLWPRRGASAALLLGLWTLAMIGLATYVALRLDFAGGKSFEALFSGERLAYPVGYPNATAAQWLMAFWPALLLARGTSLPWALRGLLAGGAVVLADVALFSLSRGSLYATPVMIVLVFAFVPQRLRTFATAVPVALGIGATAPLVLHVGDHIRAGQSTQTVTHTAVFALFAAALLVGLTVAAGAAFESRRTVSPEVARGVRRGVGAIALATLLAVVVGGLAVAGDGVGGNPITRVRHAWDSFKGGYTAEAAGSNRLLGGLGSNRYDFYRVALDEFEAHPLIGIGADNFAQQYLLHGRSDETPRYPHSVELRTLSQTGLVGTLLAVVGLGAALLAGWRAMRRSDPLARTVAAAALAGFAYWAVHGSFDWFWEFAGLGSCAFALLGIACSLAGARDAQNRDAPRARGGHEALGRGDAAPDRPAQQAPSRRSSIKEGRRALGWGPVGLAFATLASLLALAAVASLVAPWLSERQVQSAAQIWPRAPLTAYGRLGEAAKLNPLSDRPYLVEGSIALRYGDLARAKNAFSQALVRVSDDAYATLELGAIASQSGERARALVLLERAVRLDPRDPLAREALATVRAGKRVSVQALNHSILLKAEQLA
ncbi:MAG TPA: O-antigen ligase family protein [Solirubrobacteraceae bacterium]|jgi:tetratricopeptide (TPR) repeat protein|nr:O-antigen ligase family protein [Solirubrobacteraceae bacterium]